MFDDTGHFECCQCSKKFSMDAGWQSAQVECPFCGSLYSKWTDFKRFYEQCKKKKTLK